MSGTPEYENSFQFDGFPSPNGGFGGIVLKGYAERDRKAPAILKDLQDGSNKIAGANVVWINPPSLPGNGGGYPVQFVIKTTAPFPQLYEVAEAILAKAKDTGKFWFVDNDLKIDKPQARLVIDRDKLATLGLT